MSPDSLTSLAVEPELITNINYLFRSYSQLSFASKIVGFRVYAESKVKINPGSVMRKLYYDNCLRSILYQQSIHSRSSLLPHFPNRPSPPSHFNLNLNLNLLRAFSTSNVELESELSVDLIRMMEQKLSAIEHRTAYLHSVMDQPDGAPSEYSRANKELRKLTPTIDMLNKWRAKQKEIEGLKSVLEESKDDKDMEEMASEELSLAIDEEKRQQYKLLRSLLPKDDADERDSILEVRAGTGGEEASLFAMDIFKMYEKYAIKRGWKFEVLEVSESDLKGYKEASAAISGASVYGKLKFESGIHRVQRVPITEKSGRIHTSAISVAILPQADQVDVQLRNEDLRIDTYRSGGAGGQSVNTTDSAVRITHIPTGLIVTIQDERSQHKNKAKALKVLCARLYEIERSRMHASRSKLRSDQIGSGDRSERIRTYNFPQGRVTDHRVGITNHSIDDVMQGENLDSIIDALLLKQEMDAIASLTAEKLQ